MMSSATKTRKVRTFSSATYLTKLMAELDRASICGRIAQAREEAGLTQPELGEVLGVHWRTIQTWESIKTPRVPWDRLDEIARTTGTTKDWLLHGREPEVAPLEDPAVVARLDRIERLLEALVAPAGQAAREASPAPNANEG